MKKIPYIIIFLMVALHPGCKEEGRIDHIDGSAPAPTQVTDVTVRNTPGGAVLKYNLPTDKNLSYVRAEYEIQPGVVRECKSSYYKDSLVLEGFGDTGVHDVKVYSVGQNEKASEPLSVQVHPTIAPVKAASKKLAQTFGGVSIAIENQYGTNLAIVLMADTANLGYLTTVQTFYTSAAKATFAFRGLDTIPGNFAVYLRDRWNNMSDTIEATLAPMFEEIIPKNTWKEVDLPTDTNDPIENAANYMLNHIWDGILDVKNTIFSTKTDSPIPQWVTWDLGQTIILSRLKLWHRVESQWRSANVAKFELYGSTNPNPDGSWDASWIPLGKFEAVRPSGSAAITNEDIEFAKAGIDFALVNDDFAPDPFVPVRYIRFKTTETFNGPAISGSVWLNEVSFWGQIQK